MSAQGGTLGRLGPTHLPIWPVAVLLAAAIATAIALSTLGRDAAVVNPGTASTSEAVFEEITFPRGLENPAVMGTQVWGVSHVAPAKPTLVGLENPSAYGISQVSEAGTYMVGLENPSAYGISQITEATTPADGHDPIVVNGEVCGQCR
jgi:hypothetical protein